MTASVVGLSHRDRRVAILGLGYVGLPVAVRAAEAGFDVVGLDIDVGRVKRLGVGESYVEDISDEALGAVVDAGCFRATTSWSDLAGFDYAVITVPTPLRDGNPDLSYIENATRGIAPHVRRGSCVILESTTHPGTTEELVGPLLEGGSNLLAGRDFHLGYSPERIDPGSVTWTLVNTPKVVSGIDTASLRAVQGFYDRIVDRTVPVASPREAELTKLIENTFRHVNIALVNELAMFARDLGVDIGNAIEAASTKPFGYMRFDPGPGVGGHCLPIDPSYLSWQVKRSLGHAFRFVELANDVNDHMPDYVVRRLILGLNTRERALKNSRVLILGLAYKPNTADLRESPALQIADQLLTLGADVRAADPHVNGKGIDARIQRVEVTEDEVAAADLVVLVCDHAAFDLDMVSRTGRYVFDTRHRLHGANVESL